MASAPDQADDGPGGGVVAEVVHHNVDPFGDAVADTVVFEEAGALGLSGAREQGVQLRFNLNPEHDLMLVDRVQIQQVLVNLVRNAVDAIAGSQTPTPKIVISTRSTPESTVEFAVSDHGEGIPSDQLPQIFDAYYSTRVEGMGMGLAISRSIIEAHLGRIGAQSTPNLGTIVSFTLPIVGH